MAVAHTKLVRVRVIVRGTVQGVGFRPFVRRSALEHSLTGWVKNTRDAVHIEAQGDEPEIDGFTHALGHDVPAPALVRVLERSAIATVAVHEETTFRILESDFGPTAASVLPPDLATCAACLDEVLTKGNRRYRYPFTNCASCGPRYSISTGLPYDRRNTSMRAFVMCGNCGNEYDDVDDRRHHAQAIACPDCGPELTFLDPDGRVLSNGEAAIASALRCLDAGGVLALHGLGGYQLLCDATNEQAVSVLRLRKIRPHKPFAVMFRDAEELAESALPTTDEERILRSAEAPIVLILRRPDGPLAESVAPRNHWIGAMLPYTPLHALLLRSTRGPLVCTSGNVSDEPLSTTTKQALEDLSSIADGFLSHDRPIVRPLDDSIVRVDARRTVVLRRARGHVPSSVGTIDERATVLALGAHLKSTVTLGHGGVLLPSQHLGDLESLRARQLLERTIEDLRTFFDAEPNLLACDFHPDYASTIIAERLREQWSVPLLRVQHHHAHIAACMAEHGLGTDDEVLGLAWDGTGLGMDGTIWGGEALICRGATFKRFASLRPFPLLGGDRAAREPRRSALGLVFEVATTGTDACTSWFGEELASCIHILERRLAPMCSSVGRLFDAVAALLGLSDRTTFEGQAAIELEHLASSAARDGAYPLPLVSRATDRALPLFVAETRDFVDALLTDIRTGTSKPTIARRAHEALVSLGLTMAQHAGVEHVVLGGGCFQNRLLVESLEARLEAAGFKVYVPAKIPVNDGGISVGQAWLAAQHAAAIG